MVLIKPPNDWSEKTSNRYDGPPPTPGIYTGVVDKAWRTQVKEGSENAGADMLLVSVKIVDGKFKGATILRNLLVTEQNAWALNQFLDALTDGSDKQREAIKKWFWTIGYQISDEVESLGQPVTHIGKKFELAGKPITFATKMGSYNGSPRAEVDRFVIKLENSDDDDDDSATEEDDGLGEFATETTSNPAVVEEDSSPPAEGDDDDDDPWS